MSGKGKRKMFFLWNVNLHSSLMPCSLHVVNLWCVGESINSFRPLESHLMLSYPCVFSGLLKVPSHSRFLNKLITFFPVCQQNIHLLASQRDSKWKIKISIPAWDPHEFTDLKKWYTHTFMCAYRIHLVCGCVWLYICVRKTKFIHQNLSMSYLG